jgi:hypothetical protein
MSDRHFRVGALSMSTPEKLLRVWAYRQGPIAQLHALANAYPGPDEVATIYLDLFGPGSLADADVRRAREMFRRRLDRAGF